MKKVRNDRRGAAMILVLCIMAMVTALCLSLLYGLAQITANANRRADLLRTRQAAVSISDTLRDSLIDGDGNVIHAELGSGTLADVVQRFLTSASFTPMRWYTVRLDEASLPAGCKDISVSLMKNAVESPGLFDSENPKWIDLTDPGKFQGLLDIRVSVTTETGVSDVTYHYECQPDLDQLHYWYRDETVGNSLEPLRHEGVNYIVIATNEPLMAFIGMEGEEKTEVPVTDDIESVKSRGWVTETLQMYNGFTTAVPYKLAWQGEV